MTERQITLILDALGANCISYVIYKDRVVFQIKNERLAVSQIAALLYPSYNWQCIKGQLTIFNA